jgi:hypothetical protein
MSGVIAVGFWIVVFLLGVWGVYEAWVDWREGRPQRQKEKGRCRTFRH